MNVPLRVPAPNAPCGGPVPQVLVMGVLNVTPDSFSDGSEFLDPDSALRRALLMSKEGAHVIDVGPESTRPGAMPVPAEEQIARAIPVIRRIRRLDREITISIDTRLAAVANAALDAGADWVNDTSALRDDPELADVVARRGSTVVLMHRRGAPADMQRGGGPHYDDVIREIIDFLHERRKFAESLGIARSRILLDPGIGFGKRIEHNALILRHLDAFLNLGSPVVIGASRKSFLGYLTQTDQPRERDAASLAAALIAAEAVSTCSTATLVLRVHDVRSTVEAFRVWQAVREVSPTPREQVNPGPPPLGQRFAGC